MKYLKNIVFRLLFYDVLPAAGIVGEHSLHAFRQFVSMYFAALVSHSPSAAHCSQRTCLSRQARIKI